MQAFIIYDGDPGDPLAQTMRLVDSPSLEQVMRDYPDAICWQLYEQPAIQEPPDLVKLRRGAPVWSY